LASNDRVSSAAPGVRVTTGPVVAISLIVSDGT
jgi:hypothetical protein